MAAITNLTNIRRSFTRNCHVFSGSLASVTAGDTFVVPLTVVDFALGQKSSDGSAVALTTSLSSGVMTVTVGTGPSAETIKVFVIGV